MTTIRKEAKSLVQGAKTPSDGITICQANIETLGKGQDYVRKAAFYPGLPAAISSLLLNVTDFNVRTAAFLRDEASPLEISPNGRTRLLGATSQTLNALDLASSQVPESPWEDLASELLKSYQTILRKTVETAAKASAFTLEALLPILIPAAVLLVLVAYVRGTA